MDVFQTSWNYPIFKKNDDLNKENYRPAIVLINVLKVSKKIIYSHIDAFIYDKLTKLLTGFRKYHSAQYCLEIWKNIPDKGGCVEDMI